MSDRDALIDAITNAVDKFVRDGGGTYEELQSIVERVVGAVSAWQPKWQPIDTAPKDGTEILLTDGHYKRTGYWARRLNAWSVDTAVSLQMPTHWMPLPPPPEPSQP